jgi:ABC-type multidrug transport system fused ATPase/permease subunit
MFRKTDPGLRILRLFSTRKRVALFLAVLVSMAAAFDIAVPLITQRLIDTLVSYFKSPHGTVLPVLVTSAAGILVATAAGRAVRSLYTYKLFRTCTAIEDEVRFRAFENYLRLHVLYHHNANSGQIIGRIESGCGAVFGILFDIMGQNLIPPVVVFGGVLITLFSENAWIALTVMLPVPVYVLVVRRLTGRIYDIEQQGCEDFEVVSKERYDVAGNVVTVKKFSQERTEVRRQIALQNKARETQFRGERLWVVVENSQTLIATLGRVAVLIGSGWLVIAGRATVGQFVLFLTLSEMAYQPISQLSILFPRLRRSMAHADRLFGVLDEKSAVTDRPGARSLRPHCETIEFRDVWFRYGEDADWTLRGVNFTVPCGATVALVGRSGSGKTTLANLLLRMFDPQRGGIFIDGEDIRDVTQESLRAQIAVVPQEVDLFSRTVADNIAYGRPGASREEIEEAAAIAQAHDFILRTEHGYETLVGERGLKLSGGERQRIGIARAVLRDPRILVLDEATSHLDTESEHMIQQAAERVVKGRTSFIIAHRLSTILHADLIVVFDRGAVEAAGTHLELLESSPTYRRLYSFYEDEPELEGAPLA